MRRSAYVLRTGNSVASGCLPAVLPPVVSSRYNLPVRFPFLWPENLRRQTEAGERLIWDAAAYVWSDSLWPAALWETLSRTLYREISRRDPRWVQRFCSALAEFRSRDGTFNVGDLLEGLANLRVTMPRGRPPGGPQPPALARAAADDPDSLPCEFWEAMFATLYRELRRRNPRWAAGFDSAIHGVIGQAARQRRRDGTINALALLDALTGLTVTVPKGKPPGSRGATPAVVWFLRRSFMTPLTEAWDRREERYRPGTLKEVEDVWAIAVGLGYIREDFPDAATLGTGKGRRLLTVTPLALTRDVLLPVALHISADAVERAFSRARRWQRSLQMLTEMRSLFAASPSSEAQ